MLVRLVFLGRLQDLAGGAERTLELAGNSTLSGLIAMLEPELAAELASRKVRLAVNGEVAREFARLLAPGDEIAFLPPVSGG